MPNDPKMMSSNRVLFPNRRQLLAGAILIGGVPHLVVRQARASSPTDLGGKKVHIVSDGHLNLPISMYMPDAPQDELAALLKAHGKPTDAVVPDCNVTVVEQDGKLVVFDAGAGPNFMASAGRLAEQMDEVGLDREQVGDVIFTHAHPDHLWGIIDDFDEEIFPNATYRMPKAEFDYWRADETVESIGEARRSFAVGAQNRLSVMEERLETFNAGDEVISGVEAVDTSGHTPGHMSFAVHGSNENVMVIGDVIGNDYIAFDRPDWPAGSDQDPHKGAAARVKLLDRLAAEKMQVIGFHFKHPGLGRVEKAGNAFKFVV